MTLELKSDKHKTIYFISGKMDTQNKKGEMKTKRETQTL